MSDHKSLGWLSLGVFAGAVLILVIIATLMIFTPNALPFVRDNTQALFMVSGVLALIAVVLGFLSWRTLEGKVAILGGLGLSIALAVLLSSTLVRSVEIQKSAAQLYSLVGVFQPHL